MGVMDLDILIKDALGLFLQPKAHTRLCSIYVKNGQIAGIRKKTGISGNTSVHHPCKRIVYHASKQSTIFLHLGRSSAFQCFAFGLIIIWWKSV